MKRTSGRYVPICTVVGLREIEQQSLGAQQRLRRTSENRMHPHALVARCLNRRVLLHCRMPELGAFNGLHPRSEHTGRTGARGVCAGAVEATRKARAWRFGFGASS
jgi:hypothetical protein